ncbi:MAG: hypothetical protein ACI8QZ_003210, partial [Chlamydiales bacterium]
MVQRIVGPGRQKSRSEGGVGGIGLIGGVDMGVGVGMCFLGLGIWSKNRARLRLCPATPGVGTQRVLPTPA